MLHVVSQYPELICMLTKIKFLLNFLMKMGGDEGPGNYFEDSFV